MDSITTEGFQFDTDHARAQHVFFIEYSDLRLKYPEFYLPEIFFFVSERTGEQVEVSWERESTTAGDTIHHYRSTHLPKKATSGYDIVVQIMQRAVL